MEKTRKSFIELALKYRQVTVTLAVMLCLVGIYALVTMPRQEFPDFTIRQGLVIGVFPGASARQVDEQVAKPLQNYLFGFKEIDRAKTYSHSTEGQTAVYVEVKDSVRDSDAFWAKLRLGLQELKMQLPPQVAVLIGTNDFGDASAILLTISSKQRSYRELEYYMGKLEDEIRANPAVSKVQDFGLQKEQITIYADPNRLAHYGIKPALLAAALNLEGALGYGGSVKGKELEIPIHLPQRFNSEAEVANQIIYAGPDKAVVRVKDVARVVREYDVEDSFVESNGEHAVGISMGMRFGNNIVRFGDEMDAVVKKFRAENPPDLQITRIADMPGVVRHAVNHFFRDFGLAVLSVILVCMILLPRRIASVAAVTIPICILQSLGVLESAGVGLDTVSLAALVIVLGMVVDNAIVVIDNHVEKLDHGTDVWQAAWSSARELMIPIFTATLAIILAFIPMSWFLTGFAKDFCGPLPITIGVTLVISMAVSMLLVPVLSYAFIKTGLHGAKKKEQPSMLDKLQSFYDSRLAFAMLHPQQSITAGIIVIALGCIALWAIPQQLLPTVERNQFAVEIYFPEGTTLEKNAGITREMAKILSRDKRVTNVVSFIGASSPRFHTMYAPQMPAKNYSQLIVLTDTNKSTEEVLREYDAKYRNAFPEAHIRWKQLSFLNSEAPIEIRISGDDIESARAFAAKVKAVAAQEKDIIWLRDDFKEPRLTAELDVDREAANRLGITRGMLGLSTMLNGSGLPVSTIWEGDYPRGIVLKYEHGTASDPGALSNQYINPPFSPYGIALRQVATPRPGVDEGQVVRRNGKPTVTILVDVAFGKLPSVVLKHIQNGIAHLDIPESVDISYGGEYLWMRETFIPLTKGLIFSVVFIFIVLLFQFKTIRLALLIMATMPLSLLSGALGLLMLGYPFGITAFVGFIGLFGMVVRNGIILISYAHELEHSGMSVHDAAFAAGKRRLRPIFLTASAAAVGVIPLITSGSLLWGPLGTVICFGLAGSTVFTLWVLPVAYWKLGEAGEPGEED
jgi:multidrug efflux pump subunit AcrB